MEKAIRYTENMNAFVALLLKAGHRSVEVLKGRKYDRMVVNGSVTYFVDKSNEVIYGAKSAAQHNTRRLYGTLETLAQYDWTSGTPLTGTQAEKDYITREAAIQNGYKRRGRPPKIVVVTP